MAKMKRVVSEEEIIAAMVDQESPHVLGPKSTKKVKLHITSVRMKRVEQVGWVMEERADKHSPWVAVTIRERTMRKAIDQHNYGRMYPSELYGDNGEPSFAELRSRGLARCVKVYREVEK